MERDGVAQYPYNGPYLISTYLITRCLARRGAGRGRKIFLDWLSREGGGRGWWGGFLVAPEQTTDQAGWPGGRWRSRSDTRQNTYLDFFQKIFFINF